MKISFNKDVVLLFLTSFLVLQSCKTIFKSSAYNSYINSLQSAGLSNTLMVKNWIKNGETAILKPAKAANIPFKEEMYFKSLNASALGFSVYYKKGRSLKFRIKTQSKDSLRVFLDIFERTQDLKNVLSAQTADTVFNYDNRDEQQLIIRIQPELLTAGKVTVEIIDEPQLAFPVKGGSNKSIKSFWGVDRDGGQRKHEGIDIFAKRGTPVLAVADGVINRVQVTNIGGKVVWQRLGLFEQSIYYAHLDSQLVADGQEVKKGETIGLVGNTGNAITTTPHLHFGIYTMGGAVDPINYVLLTDTTQKRLKREERYLGREVVIEKFKNQAVPVNVIAVSTKDITILNEIGETQVIKDFKIAKKPNAVIASSKTIYQQPGANMNPVGVFNPKEKYTVLGVLNDSLYIDQNNNKGWVIKD